MMGPIWRARRHAGAVFTWVDAESPLLRPRLHNERLVGECIECGAECSSHSAQLTYTINEAGLMVCLGPHRGAYTLPPEHAVGAALIKGTEYIFYGAYRVTYVDPETKEEIEI